MIKRFAAAVACLFALAACSEAQVDYEPEWKPTTDSPSVSFSASVRRQGDLLAISYTLRNQGAEPVVAYIGVPGDAASHAWDVYVTARPGGVVEVAKRTFAIPPDVKADSVGEIEGVVLEPGVEFKEDFKVSLPLEGRRPYVGAVKLPDPVEQVVFCVGAVLQEDAASPKPADRGRGKYPANGPQHLFCSEIQEL